MARNTALKLVCDDAGWTPRSLPGGFYCSPRCGGSKGFCRRSAYDKAVKLSGDLAARLGDGWQARVWENLGWHWEVAIGDKPDNIFERNGIIVRLRDHSGKYEAEFVSHETTMCSHVTQFYAEADTPEEAVGFVRQDVRTFLSRLEATLSATI